MPLRVAFFGTPGFRGADARAPGRLARITVVGVVTQPDRPRGRGQQVSDAPVKALAAARRPAGPAAGAPRAATVRAADFAALNADLGVVAAYGKILPDWLLRDAAARPDQRPRVAAAALPRRLAGSSRGHRRRRRNRRHDHARGQGARRRPDARARRVVPIGPDDTTTDRRSACWRSAAPSCWCGRSIRSTPAPRAETPQDESLVTYAPKLAKSEGRSTGRRRRPSVHNLIRGLWPWPHAFSYLGDVRYILHRSRLSPLAAGAAPGTIVAASAIDGLHVACGDGTAIELLDVQLEGKRVMSARDAMAAKAPGRRRAVHLAMIAPARQRRARCARADRARAISTWAQRVAGARQTLHG